MEDLSQFTKYKGTSKEAEPDLKIPDQTEVIPVETDKKEVVVTADSAKEIPLREMETMDNGVVSRNNNNNDEIFDKVVVADSSLVKPMSNNQSVCTSSVITPIDPSVQPSTTVKHENGRCISFINSYILIFLIC